MLFESLDQMSVDDLMSFWASHRGGRGRQALGLRGPGSVTMTADLANYAANKATAMRCRLSGDVAVATMYESIADGIRHARKVGV